MTTVTRSSYSLRQFTSSSDKDFVAALALYVRYTAPSVRTSTNEISFWIDNADVYQQQDDRFLVVGFYCGNTLIGFAEMAYLASSHALVIDYLIIESSYRKHNTFFEFIEHIKAFVGGLHLDMRYAIAEIGKFGSVAPPDNSREMVRLLKIAGFKVAKALYYQPQLGDKNADSRMEAILMVYVHGDGEGAEIQSRIARATYLEIVKSVYFDHYLRWYKPHIDDIENYRKELEESLRKIEASIKMDSVELNGHHRLMEVGSAETATREKNLTLTAGLGLGIVVLVVGCLLAITRFIDIPSGLLVILYMLVFVSFVGVMASLKESPTGIFKEAVRLFRKLCRTQE